MEMQRSSEISIRDEQGQRPLFDDEPRETLNSGTLPPHRHRRAYATIVKSGAYTEAAVEGRLTAQRGMLILHPAHHLHSDIITETGAAWNVTLPDGDKVIWRAFAGPHVEKLIAKGVSPAAEDVFEAADIAEPLPFEHAPKWIEDIAHSAFDDFSKAASARSREHAHRTFKKHFGMTPGRYRREKMLQTTLSALRAGRSLAESALEAGFADQSHMSRVVRRELMCTPGEIQRRITHVQDPP